MEESVQLLKKEVMPHQSGRAFSEEFITIFVVGAGQQSATESSKAPGSKTSREISYCELRDIFLLQSNA